jgi:ATP-binding cassette subfamily B protein
VVHQPEIYLFDDSFSALDYATDAALRAGGARRAETTALIVAQRVATIRTPTRSSCGGGPDRDPKPHDD